MNVERFSDERGVVVARRLTCVPIDAVRRILGWCTQGEHRLRSGFTTLGSSLERDAAMASRTTHGSNIAAWVQKNPRAEARGENNRVTLRCNSETTCSFHLASHGPEDHRLVTLGAPLCGTTAEESADRMATIGDKSQRNWQMKSTVK